MAPNIAMPTMKPTVEVRLKIAVPEEAQGSSASSPITCSAATKATRPMAPIA